MFLLSETPTANIIGPTQPRIYWVMVVKRPERKVKHSPSPNAYVRNKWRYTSIPPIRRNDAHRYKCTFYFIRKLYCITGNKLQFHTDRTGSSAASQFTREPDKRDSQWRLTEVSFLPLATKQINGGNYILKPYTYFMYHQLEHSENVFSPQCIYVFCVDLRTNSDHFSLQHQFIGFYNWASVYCAVRTGSLNQTASVSSLKS